MDNNIKEKMTSNLVQIQDDLRVFETMFNTAIDAVHIQDVSHYPILIAHQEDTIALGLPIIKRSDAASHYDYALSTLEELVGKNVVAQEKVNDFIEKYKASGDSYCILVMIDEIATFAFQARKL